MRKLYLLLLVALLSLQLADAAIPKVGITRGNISLITINSSNYWDNLNSPADIFLKDLADVIDSLSPSDGQVLTFNSTSGLWAARSVTSSSSGSFNATYNTFAYNQTLAAFTALNQTSCPPGNYSFGLYLNGTVMCRSDLTGGAGNADYTNIAYYNRSVDWMGNNITANFFFGKINVTRGFGLVNDGSIISNTQSVAVEPTVIQRRVTGECGDGSAMTIIAEDGTVTCAAFYDRIFIGAGITESDPSGEIENDETISVEDNTIRLHINNITGSDTNVCGAGEFVHSVNFTDGNLIIGCASTSSSGSFNATYHIWAYNQTTPAIVYLNSTYGKWWYNMSDGSGTGSSFNATYAIWAYNQTYSGSTFNSTYNIWSYNQTYSGSTFNATYDGFRPSVYNHTIATLTALNQTNCPSGLVAYGIYLNGTFLCKTDSTGSANATFNQSLTDTLYAAIRWGYNQTYSGSTFNSTYNLWSYNQSTGAIVIINVTQCPTGQYIFGFQLNGTPFCRSDQGSGNVSGDGASQRVAYWTGSNTISGSSGLTYDGSTMNLTNTGASILNLISIDDILTKIAFRDDANEYSAIYLDLLGDVSLHMVNRLGNGLLKFDTANTTRWTIDSSGNFISGTTGTSIHNISTGGNISAAFFVGDGRRLVNTPTFNATYNLWAYNQTVASGSTFNATYHIWAYNQTYSGSTFNATYNIWSYNQTYSGSTFNSSYDAKNSSQWIVGGSDITNRNTGDVNITQDLNMLSNNITLASSGRVFLNRTTNPIYFNGTCTRLEGTTSSISIC